MKPTQLLVYALAVGGAGFLGAIARFLIGLSLNRWTLPWGTLLINVSGAFILGWFMAFATSARREPLSPTLVYAVATGFIGTFTTFSTLMYESNTRLEEGASWLAMGYLTGSVVLGMLAVKAGVMLGR